MLSGVEKELNITACVCSYSCPSLLPHLSCTFQTFHTGTDQSFLCLSNILVYLSVFAVGVLHQRTLHCYSAVMFCYSFIAKHAVLDKVLDCSLTDNKDSTMNIKTILKKTCLLNSPRCHTRHQPNRCSLKTSLLNKFDIFFYFTC